ncbi:Gag polyprotein, partial [Plecturocebus cupreus]
MPVGAAAVPEADPNWDYQDSRDGRRRRDQMLQCLLAGMQSAAQKVVDYDKLKEITQGSDENPATFLDHLTNAMIFHTRLDPASLAGATVLATHFISQSAADIRKKLKKAEEGPQTPIRHLVNMAFKVFNGQEYKPEATRQAHLRQK